MSGIPYLLNKDNYHQLVSYSYMLFLWALLISMILICYWGSRKWANVFFSSLFEPLKALLSLSEKEGGGFTLLNGMQQDPKKEESQDIHTITIKNDDSLNQMKMKQQQLFSFMPTPPSMPIIGHMHLLRDYQDNPWDGFNAIREQYGDIVGLKMGIHSMVLVSSLEAIREVLLKKSDIFADRPLFPRHHIIFGGDKENSLALCNYSSTHKERRKLCKRGISGRNQLLETIVRQRTTKFVQQQTQEKSLTKSDLLLLTSDIFMEFFCDEEYPHNEILRKFATGCDFVFWDINQSYLIDFLPYLTSLGFSYFYLRRLKNETDFLRDFINTEIFDPRLDAIVRKNIIDDEQQEQPTLNLDYLDSLILEYLSRTTSMSLADYKVGFADLLAGHAAVANILIRVLGHLALDEKIQDLIKDEAERAESLSEPLLPMAEAALLEALRLASSPIVPHVAREDTSIGDYFVPANSMVLFNIYHQNLSEKIWNDPYKYDPLRFIIYDEGKAPKLNVPKHFMPFSVGMRQCLGQKLVEKTSIVFISKLCRKFTIRTKTEPLVKELLKPKGCVALNPDNECFELVLSTR